MGSHQLLAARARGFSPSDVAGLLLWLNADVINQADGSAVGTWADSSGNANDATAISSPTLRLNQLNGHPSVEFGGNGMSTPSISKGVFSLFYVYSSSAGMLMEQGPNAGTNDGDYHYTPGGAHFAVHGGGNLSAKDISGTNVADGAYRYISRTFDGTHAGHLAWINGVSATLVNAGGTGDPGTGATNAAYTIGRRSGGSLSLSGKIAEIILYNTVLSTGNRQFVEGYLAAKYAL